MHQLSIAPRGIHFSPFPDQLSGANRSLLTLVEELAKRGPVYVLSLCEGALATEARKVGATVLTSFKIGEKNRCKSRWLRWAKTVNVLRKAIPEHGINLVHCHSAAGSRCAWPGAKIAGVPLVNHQRDTYRSDNFHRGLGLADHIIAISQCVKESLPPRLQTNTTLIYNAVKLPPRSQISRSREEGRLRVGMAGRCTPDKGQDLLIEAALSLLKHLDFELYVWGLDDSGKHGIYARQLRQQVATARPGASAHFHFEPFRHDIETFYKSVDIVVIPSRYKEPLSRMVIEAMSWEKPVLVAGHGGLIEIVEDSRTGLTFRPGDWQSLGEQLERLLRDEDLRRRLGKAGRAEVERRFSAPRHADAVEAVYRKVLSHRAP